MQNRPRQFSATTGKRRRTVLMVSAALLVVGLLTAILPPLTGISWSRSTARRIATNPIWKNGGSFFRNGRVYWITARETEVVFYTAAPENHRSQVLYRLESKDSILLQTLATDREIWALTGSGLSYSDLDKVRRERDSFVHQGKRIYVGSYRRRSDPSEPLPPRASRVEAPRPVVRGTHPAVLHRIPLDGGPVRKTTLDTGGYQLALLPRTLTEKGVFWVAPHTTKRTIVMTKEGGAFEEGRPTDDLMFSPADGGKAQLRWRGVFPRTNLRASGNGLYLRTAGVRDGTGGGAAVHRFSLADTNTPPVDLSDVLSGEGGTTPDDNAPLIAVGGTGGPATVTGTAPVLVRQVAGVLPLERDGLLYWYEPFPLSGEEASPHAPPGTVVPYSARVWRCRPDGTERQVVWDGRDEKGEAQQLECLFIDGGRLYASCMPSVGKDARRQARIVRLHPDRFPTLGNSQPLPPGTRVTSAALLSTTALLWESVRIDGGSVYVTASGKRRSPLDFLSREETEYTVFCVYRIPLPE